MKRIEKIKESSKAVAGTALLVGATIAGGAAMVSASSHSGSSGSGDLGDYPHPFINDDGEIASTLVMGADAKATDVVAATEIAGQLGNDAAMSETRSVDVSGSFGWSADGGVTLDTRNDQLYFGDTLDSVRETLTEDDLDFLAETTFRDDSGTETDITSYLNVGAKDISFGNDVDGLDNEDPVLHVPVPSEGEVNDEDYLVNLQANFGDSLNFSDEDVQGEEIELFGKTYTVSQDDNAYDDSELVLYGSSEEVTVETGESTTVTINGEEHTLEVVSVNSGGSDGNAAIRVDGNLRSEDTDATFNIDGQQVRVDQIIKTGGSESSSGVVQFAIGSEELVLSHDSAIEDDDGDEIEGTHVMFNGDGGLTSGNLGEGVSSIDLYLGSEDDDSDYLAAGDSWSHSMFEDVEVHFGGLNPDASENGENVGQVEVSTSGDDTATIDFTGNNGDSASVEWAFYDEEDDQVVELADSDGDAIVSAEGQPVAEDEYFATDAGDFAHMWEVTSVDFDSSDNEESTVDLRDAVTGNTVEVELDHDDGDVDDTQAQGEEIIDGQTYYFDYDSDSATDSGSDTGLEVTWGDSAGYEDTGQSGDGATSVFTPVDTDSGAAIALAKDAVVAQDVSEGDTVTLELPSTESTDEQQVDVTVPSSSSTFTVGQLDYRARYDGNDLHVAPATVTESTDTTLSITVSDYFASDSSSDTQLTAPVSDNSAGDSLDQIEITDDDVQLPSATSNYTVDYADGSGGWTSVTVSQATTSNNGNTVTLDFNDSPPSSLTADRDVRVRMNTTDVTSGSNPTKFTINPQSDPTTTYTESGSTSVDPVSVAAITMEPEDDSDNENAYINTVSYDDADDDELDVQDASYTGDTREQQTLESDDNVEAGYDVFGAYSEYDDDGQGEFTLNIPDGQSTAGAAVTGAEGGLSASAGATGTVESMMPTGWPAQSVALDSDDYISEVQDNRNLILVGGPAANGLVQDLADMNKTWSTSDYTEGEGLLQLVPEAFNDEHDALVVAGYTGEDTRAAGNFLANYGQHEEALSGETQVTVDTASGSVVE
ncbi:S-layer protein [Candidatus Nanosalina sp. VS9-1]|uniref:S-layer protein n=1 Tax=Candidatus Nanosalina sp. VS9-1 TaxID=3388566 RepID=UPI0039E16259